MSTADSAALQNDTAPADFSYISLPRLHLYWANEQFQTFLKELVLQTAAYPERLDERKRRSLLSGLLKAMETGNEECIRLLLPAIRGADRIEVLKRGLIKENLTHLHVLLRFWADDIQVEITASQEHLAVIRSVAHQQSLTLGEEIAKSRELQVLIDENLINIRTSQPPAVDEINELVRNTGQLSIARPADALYDACETRNCASVQSILAEKQQFPQSVLDGALAIAARSGALSIVQYLLKHTTADPQSNDNEPFRMACRNKRGGIVAYMARKQHLQCHPSTQTVAAEFLRACADDNTCIARELLNMQIPCKPDPSANDSQCIHVACLHNSHNVLRLLLGLKRRTKPDPSACDNRALVAACEVGAYECYKILMGYQGRDRLPQLSAGDFDAFRRAARNGHLRLVQDMLARHLDSKRVPDAVKCQAYREAKHGGQGDMAALLWRAIDDKQQAASLVAAAASQPDTTESK